MATVVTVESQAMAWHGLLLRRGYVQLASPDYCCRIAIDGGFGGRLDACLFIARDSFWSERTWSAILYLFRGSSRLTLAR